MAMACLNISIPVLGTHTVFKNNIRQNFLYNTINM